VRSPCTSVTSVDAVVSSPNTPCGGTHCELPRQAEARGALKIEAAMPVDAKPPLLPAAIIGGWRPCSKCRVKTILFGLSKLRAVLFVIARD